MMIKFSKNLNAAEQKIVQPVIQRNGYHAHPEIVLLKMMTDEDESVQKKAVTAVLEVGERERLGEGQEEMEYEESVEVRGEEDEEEDLFPD